MKRSEMKKKSTLQDIKIIKNDRKKMAKEYVQCTLQTDTRQQMRYKKVGKEIHGKKKMARTKNKKQARGRGRVSKHGCSTRFDSEKR